MKNKYKVGDKVRIMDKRIFDSFATSGVIDPNRTSVRVKLNVETKYLITFTSRMSLLCGETCTIKKVNFCSGCGYSHYELKESENFSWDEWMFENSKEQLEFEF